MKLNLIKMIGTVCATMLTMGLLSGNVMASDAKVVDVKAYKEGDSWTFDVTLEHEDTGWEHYADAWRVVSEDGKKVYGTRTLFHPHETEQPFTRSQSGIKIPAEIDSVVIEAHDKISGWSSDRFKYTLPK